MGERGILRAGFDPRTLLILLPSLLVTLAAWWGVSSQERALQRVRFDAVADEAVAEIVNRVATYEHTLRGASALFDASSEVKRDDWGRYVARLDLGRRYPGIQGLGFAERVAPDRLEQHERDVHASGYPDYRVTPTHPREIYYPIVFLEPLSGRNLRAFGYDMFSDPVRRAAMVRARDSFGPTLSGKVMLVQETGEDVQAGALLYLPVYQSGGDVSDPDARRAAIQGFVYAPFRIGDLVTAILGRRLDAVCIGLFDESMAPENLLFANPGCTPGAFEVTQVIDMYGREWIVRIRSTPALDTTLGEGVFSWIVLVSGFAITLLLMIAAHLMIAERHRWAALRRANQALDAARRQAEGADAAKTRFLAAASHDLRQPLQTLGIYLHLLADRGGERLRPLVESAMQGFDATSRLLNSLLDIAALESGKMRPEVKRIDIAALVTRIADEARPAAQLRGLDLRVRMCTAEVETDPVMLERVVRNLVENALKYTRAGGILVACRATVDAVRISVADSGPGIPSEQRELIFEDFYQIANQERDSRKGVGLGLATVARLSRLLGYRLELFSRMGQGSTFVVVVPRQGVVPAAGFEPATP